LADFEDGVQALKLFLEQHRHVRVPAKHVQMMNGRSFNLGAWVSHRRSEFKREKLPLERISLLDELEFIWDPIDADFERGIHALKQYLSRQEDANVPKRHIELLDGEEVKLGRWLEVRRRKWKRGTLSAEHTAVLDKIGMVWDPIEAAFQQGVRALEQFIAREHHARVPYGHREWFDEKEFKLGIWVSLRRRERWLDTLSKAHFAVLDRLGFVWNVKV